MPKPPTIALPAPSWGLWKKKEPAYAAQFPTAPAQAAPVSVAAAQPASKPAHKPKPLFVSPLMTLDGKGDLNCENVKQPSTGRVSVVCK